MAITSEYGYSFDNGENVVSSDKVDEYIKKYWSDYLDGFHRKGSDYVSHEIKTYEVVVTYRPLAENCATCDELGNTVGMCDCAEVWEFEIPMGRVQLYL